jgi:hypothetical protein
MADFVMATPIVRFSPNFGRTSKQSYRKVMDIKIKLILIRLQSCKILELKILV